MVTTVGKTQIGSHIWAMNNKWSDEDYYEIYCEDITDVLTGKAKYDSTFVQRGGVDTHMYEISTVVKQLLKGNMNHIIGVLSPKIKTRTTAFMNLRTIARKEIARNCFHSINGMAEGNYYKYVIQGEDRSPKKCGQILRSIQMGITILKRGKVEFKPFHDGTPDDVLELLSEMQFLYMVSGLPEQPNEDNFYLLLERMRVDQFNSHYENW